MQNKPLLPSGSSNRAAFVAARMAGLFAGGLGLYLAYGSITELFRHVRDSQTLNLSPRPSQPSFSIFFRGSLLFGAYDLATYRGDLRKTFLSVACPQS